MRVIVNADDFGLCSGVNRGIIRAFEEGVVRSASLMAVGGAFPEAAAYLRKNPGLDAGVHITLTDESPLTSAAEMFPGSGHKERMPGMAELFRLVALGRADLPALGREMEAQVRAVKDAGVSVSHADGHQHVHLFARIFPRVLDLCRRHGIRFVRTRLTDRISLRAGVGRLAQYAALRAFLRSPLGPRTPPDMPCVPCTGFLLSGGKLGPRDAARNLRALSGFPAAEVILHPGLCGLEDRAAYGHWEYDWESDLGLALGPELPRVLDEMGALPSSFRELGREISFQ